ncbi:MAG: hypothetical protein LBD55_05510 [Treponema sp.]|jgi:polyhydroxyalkanoate synthesis regulator phasin|nr:hypothetical protein [Treponema sp.]
MLFGLLEAKKTKEQIKEAEQAWALYGNEVDAFLEDAKIRREFEGLEKSKYAARPKLKARVIAEEDAPLPEDLKLRVERGDIQASKARRFMADPELKKMLFREGLAAPQEALLPEGLKKRVEQGDIQASKARRFMTDPQLRAMLQA